MESLSTLAEVFVAFAGFSGVVAVFGRRGRPSTWPFYDRIRFYLLVEYSLTALLFCFVPATLRATGLGESETWRIVSTVFSIYALSSGTFRLRQVSKGPESELVGLWRRPSGSAALPGGFIFGVTYVYLGLLTAVSVTNLINALVWGESWPFMVAMLFLLMLCSFLFARMLMSGFDEPTLPKE